MIISKKGRCIKIKNKIIAYGGAFNPPLNSHFSIAEQVLNQFEEVKKIVFIPVNNNYKKSGLIDAKHRFNMIKLVVEKNDKFEVSNMDMNEKRSLYTIETLENMQEKYPNDEICFLCGSDNLKEINTWKFGEKLISKYKIIVAERDTDLIDDIIKNDALLNCYKKNIIKLKGDIKFNFSSTYVRTQLKKRKCIRYLLPDEVFYYIKDNRLYIN